MKKQKIDIDLVGNDFFFLLSKGPLILPIIQMIRWKYISKEYYKWDNYGMDFDQAYERL